LLRSEKVRVERLLGGKDVEKVAEILPRAMDTYKATVSDRRNTTQREIAVACTQVKKLLGGDVKLIPRDG
jgi:hypothetical protein